MDHYVKNTVCFSDYNKAHLHTAGETLLGSAHASEQDFWKNVTNRHCESHMGGEGVRHPHISVYTTHMAHQRYVHDFL